MRTTTGNILDAEGLKCIPVNMVGVTGAGLAKQWADRVDTPPLIMYKKACWSDFIRTNSLVLGEWWLFPTKDHWRNKSNLADIVNRLKLDLKEIGKQEHKVVNIPKLGCGLGGLSWENEVLPAITPILKAFEHTYESEVVLFG